MGLDSDRASTQPYGARLCSHSERGCHGPRSPRPALQVPPCAAAAAWGALRAWLWVWLGWGPRAPRQALRELGRAAGAGPGCGRALGLG